MNLQEYKKFEKAIMKDCESEILSIEPSTKKYEDEIGETVTLIFILLRGDLTIALAIKVYDDFELEKRIIDEDYCPFSCDNIKQEIESLQKLDKVVDFVKEYFEVENENR